MAKWLRYLWTDSFGLVLLISLYRDLHEQTYLDDAEKLAMQVDRVLGRPRGIRIGEAADRDGQYFHYLAVWLYALTCLSEHLSHYRPRAIAQARDVPGSVMAHWTHLTDTSCIDCLAKKRSHLKLRK